MTAPSLAEPTHRLLRARAAVLIALAGFLCSCATASRICAQERAGWRVGRVTAIVDAAVDPDAVRVLPASGCVSPTGGTGSRIALVAYSSGARMRRTWTATVPDSLELGVGDRVRLNVSDCSTPLAKLDR
jgi:hypothetical protein